MSYTDHYKSDSQKLIDSKVEEMKRWSNVRMRTLKAVATQKCRKVLDTKCGAEDSDDDQEPEEMREMVE